MESVLEVRGTGHTQVEDQLVLKKEWKCITEYFYAVAKENANQPCMEYNDKVYSFDEVNQLSNQLASYLKGIGVGPEVPVGLFLERSPDMIISILAIWKAGGAYVPISTTYPKDRIEFILNDANLRTILTTSSMEHILLQMNTESKIDYILLDKEKEQIESHPQANLPCENRRNDLAYIIFTSGSTGRPKGVMVEHEGIPNLVLEQIKAFKLNGHDKVLQFASISFDASVSEIFTTLIAGATLVLLPNDALFLGEDLYQVLKNKRITVVTLTPSVLNTLPDKELPDMKSIISAGEACTRKLIEYWSSRVNFLNAYGPTECTICASMHVCTLGEEAIPLGEAIANTKLYLLNEQLQPVELGETGELCVAGVGLARGYLNNEELTKRSFIPNPFGDGLSDRLYRTGDLCRYIGNVTNQEATNCSDAVDNVGDLATTSESSSINKSDSMKLEWVGRLDNQVKISGLRIDLDELVHVMREYPGVADAVVTIIDDSMKNKQIYAYILSDASVQVSINSIKSYLKTKLPAYMVPSRFLFLSEIPVLESGKLDRNSLPSIEDVRPDIDVEYVAPRNPMEETLAQIWCEILQIDRVGIYDNFFDLGGQSLMATQMISRIRTTLGMEIPLHVIFETTPTVEQTAIAIENYQIEQSQPEDLEKLLAEIEAMSEEEIAAMLGDIEG
jgi:amino acid adenylation domain-containing protein